MSVNADISDLFFNHDNSNAELEDGGYNTSELLSNADDVLGSLRRLGVVDLPTPSELVEDFEDRT